MPEKALLENHVAIKGPGLDEVLEPGAQLVLLDNFYSDLYGDYVFLGYDTYSETVEAWRGDIVGLYTAAILLEKGRSVMVCGREPWGCLGAATAWRILQGEEPREALRWAAERLRDIYPELNTVPAPMAAALEALAVLRRLAGRAGLGALMALGANYEYGEGRLHYGDAVSWAQSLGLGGDAVAAAALHFLAEGPGAPRVLLGRRLEALGGRRGLIEALGAWAEKALGLVETWVEKGEGPVALLEKLGPGGTVLYAERREGGPVLYCGPGDAPPKECVEAARALEEAGAGAPRLRLEKPPMLRL